LATVVEAGGVVTITKQVPVLSLAAQALDLAFPDAPGFKGQGWSSQETAMAVRWLFANPAAWERAMAVARQYPQNPHTVADTLHEQIVPRSELEAIARGGGDPSKVNWLEIAHELIERRDDPLPSAASEHAGITGQALSLAAQVPGPDGADTAGDVPDDKTAVAMATAHLLDDTARHLAHASGRLDAAIQASPGELADHHMARCARSLDGAHKSAHDLAAHLRARYPAEGAELDALTGVVGLARGYELNPRSGMISLDLPPGTIAPVPGGVTDFHITVVYLGPDVDDKAFAQACDRAKAAAAAMPGPLTGTAGGIGTFPPSAGSDGKVPAWAGVVLPGAERLRSSLEDLSASEHKDWKPHVTLAYVEPGEPLPAPVPQTQVMFTSLSVHRGDDEVARFPLGGGPQLASGLAGQAAIGLARSVSEDAKTATTGHLVQTICNHMAHTIRHVQAMQDDPAEDVRDFNGEHARTHLDGALEHVGKLTHHLTDNYPREAGFLAGLGTAVQDAEPETISGQAGAAGRPKADPSARS
jgi:hypothetical protein